MICKTFRTSTKRDRVSAFQTFSQVLFYLSKNELYFVLFLMEQNLKKKKNHFKTIELYNVTVKSNTRAKKTIHCK